jgi:hypothetical protein
MLPYMLTYPSSFPLAVLVLSESVINRVLNPLEFVLCALRGCNPCIRRVLHEFIEGSEFDTTSGTLFKDVNLIEDPV